MKIQNICWTCASSGGSCCVNMQIYLTSGDIGRINEALGHRRFFKYEGPWSWCERDGLDEQWKEHVLGSSRRRVLKRTRDGSCSLLGDEGCVLDLETRPLVCRLYPYEYMPQGICGLHHGCPASKDPHPDKALEEMGMRSDRVGDWHRTLYAELSRAHRSKGCAEK